MIYIIYKQNLITNSLSSLLLLTFIGPCALIKVLLSATTIEQAFLCIFVYIVINSLQVYKI